MNLFISPSIHQLIELAFSEDVINDDMTSLFTITEDKEIEAYIVAKNDVVFCGNPIVKAIIDKVNPNIQTEYSAKDGQKLKKGEICLRLKGNARSILMIERTLLNFLQRMTGIATQANEYVETLNNPEIRLVDTRKTLPGFRSLDKYAVRVGGAFNHRMGLSDGILIKDNHISACGSIKQAVENVRRYAPHTMKIECEVTNMEELKEAIESNVDIVMLDNMTIPQMEEAISFINGKALIEVSGNVTKERLKDLSKLKVDIISSGALTHSVKAADLSMKFK